MRETLDDLDGALDHVVDPAAVVAGDAADHEAEDEAQGDAEQADGERDARRVDDTAEHVAPESVGAEQEKRSAFGRTDEMEAAGDEAPELVLLAQAEEAQLLHLRRVGRIDALQGVGIALHLEAVDE